MTQRTFGRLLTTGLALLVSIWIVLIAHLFGWLVGAW